MPALLPSGPLTVLQVASHNFNPNFDEELARARAETVTANRRLQRLNNRMKRVEKVVSLAAHFLPQ